MKIKYIVKHDGHTWTRSTERTYTHAVIGVRSLAKDRARAEEIARYDWKRDMEYRLYVVSGQPHTFDLNSRRPFTLAAVTDAAQIAETQATIDGGEEAYVAAHLARYDSRMVGVKLASDGLHYYTDAAWAGRPDLARKKAEPGDIILEAQEVVK